MVFVLSQEHKSFYLRLWRGNLLANTRYAAFRTDSLTSKVQPMIAADVALEGGSAKITVLRTSCTVEALS